MSDRRLVIEVGGREAIPVRAIPYITGWLLSPDKVARQLSGDAGTNINVLGGMTAYRLSAGIAIQVKPKEWDSILASIYLLQHQLKTEYPFNESDSASPDFGYAAWREKSPSKLPADVFVWKDEFELAFFEAYSHRNLTILDERPGERELNYAPILPAGVIINATLENQTKILAECDESTQTLGAEEPVVPKQRSHARDEEILKLLRKKGYDPLALPPYANDKPGVKAEIRKALGNKGLWAGTTVFDKAWERLRKNGDIADRAE